MESEESLGGNGRLLNTSAQMAPPEPPRDRQWENQEDDTFSVEPYTATAPPFSALSLAWMVEESMVTTALSKERMKPPEALDEQPELYEYHQGQGRELFLFLFFPPAAGVECSVVSLSLSLRG